MSGFHGAFATGVACQQGTLTLPDTWFRPPLWDLLVLQLLRPDSSNLPYLYSTFHIEYPLVLSRFCLYPIDGAVKPDKSCGRKPRGRITNAWLAKVFLGMTICTCSDQTLHSLHVTLRPNCTLLPTVTL